jgi:hypothetical protein
MDLVNVLSEFPLVWQLDASWDASREFVMAVPKVSMKVKLLVGTRVPMSGGMFWSD